MLRDVAEPTTAVFKRYSTDLTMVSKLEHCVDVSNMRVLGPL